MSIRNTTRTVIVFKLAFLFTTLLKAQSISFPPASISANLTHASTEFIKKNSGSPGVIIRIYKPGNWDWTFVSGTGNISSNTPATPDMVFRIASISKLFCATAVLQLASKGIISLDDKIGLWLSKEYIEKLKNGDQITIRNLLQHTSGLYEPQATTNFLQNPSKDYSTSILSIISNQELSFTYGAHHYSGANYNLLAEIVKIASGMTYKDYLAKHIFKPLGLNNTYVDALPSGSGYFHGYIPCAVLPNCKSDDTNLLVDYSHANMSWGAGSADISSNTKDLISFYAALKGGKLLPGAWVDSMTTKPVKPAHKQMYSNYGYGTMIFEDGLATGHTGNAAGYTNFLCQIAGKDIYVCISMNRYFIPFSGLKDYLSAIKHSCY
ncbi:serine hydrolase domain-containing protein [Pedobacter frigoris]|uniref:Beta-lactamase family protein n=1 Tax=Pedobacter frigoris TaxID=2571272 RepID=A0A4U1CQ46_9SPHI|nr:serine hydrolase domain-containing protein [Pedobacter frigoris]TKC09436.1 beta-lactamase family protein [Pedobacter frigoris]